MKLLLDTHIFLWFIGGDRRLSEAMRGRLRNPDNTVYLSVVSLWEAIIKYQIGKLPLPESPASYFPTHRERHQIANLPLDEASVARLTILPAIHRDPFDRMLICQAIEHNLTLVTVDEAISSYPVTVLYCG